MYSLPKVLGDKVFDCGNLPVRMYGMKPYYEIVLNSASSSGEESKISESSNDLPPVLPLPTNLNPNDPNTLLTVNDILSRQMLLLCRLNEVDRVQNESKQTKPICWPSECRRQYCPPSNVKDIVIHFDPRQIPFTLLSALKVIKLDKGLRSLIRLHRHSTIVDDTNLPYQLDLLQQKLDLLNFSFDNFGKSRADFDLMITLVAKRLDDPNQCYAVFNTSQPVVYNQLFIVQDLTRILLPEQKWTAQQSLWHLMQPDLVGSEQNIIEFFAGYCVELSDKVYSLPKSSYPTMYDVVIWSLIHNGSRCLDSLINFRWKKALNQFVTTE